MKYFILIASFLLLITACKKDKPVTSTTQQQCDVKGTYQGTATASGSSTASPMVYELRDNNFAVGSITVGGVATTFGGYHNTCDSVIISSWYNGNSSYYLLKGMLTSNRTVISGTFNNLTNTNDFGTFTLTKQ
jgi:hypothetical protein